MYMYWYVQVVGLINSNNLVNFNFFFWYENFLAYYVYTGQQISKHFLYLWWICYKFICLHL